MHAADPGSFRDPTNQVLLADGRVFRGLDATAAADHHALTRSAMFARETDAGRIVGTRKVDDVPAPLAAMGWETVLEHDRIPVISYPYEWSFSMLKDAALLQLDLTLAALDEELITKDATPFNVQFLGTRPVHIDLGSFEPYRPGEPWFGARQFSEQLLHPLLLAGLRGIPHQPALRGSLRGISAADCAAALRRRDLLRPSIAVHVGLHARAERRRAAADADARQELKAAGFGRKVIEGQLRRLRKLVDGLDWDPGTSVWSDYSERQHYADDDLRAKADFVRRVAGQRHRRQVLDLGANDGYFSDVVLPSAEYVVAVDHDALVVERLYRRLREAGEERILPLVIDLVDPPGGHGWRSTERGPFVQRVRPDLVLCLALVHHLVISESIPAHEVVGFLAELDAELVLELPDPEDEKVQLLLRQKQDPQLMGRRYRIDLVEAALDERFETVARERVGSRTLYHARPRRSASTAADQGAAWIGARSG